MGSFDLKCICCGTAIKNTFEEKQITEDNVDSQSFENGAAARIIYGYGCDLDTCRYIIAICRDCTIREQRNGRIIFLGDYYERA